MRQLRCKLSKVGGLDKKKEMGKKGRGKEKDLQQGQEKDRGVRKGKRAWVSRLKESGELSLIHI